MKNLKSVSVLVLAVLTLCAAVTSASEITVASLNCYLCFDPAIPHSGQIAQKNRLSPEQFSQKVENLASLLSGANFVALQEVGGRDEIERLASVSHMEWAFAKGRDSYTGEEVGALFSLPGWRVAVDGRVADLDRIISKHLLVTAARDKQRVRFLVVHLIRPIGGNVSKHQEQIEAISTWVKNQQVRDPGATIVVIGDCNDATETPGTSLFGVGREAGELTGFSATHITGKAFDRLVAVGAVWTSAEIRIPPIGKKPNALQKSLWTDHFLIRGVLQLPKSQKKRFSGY